MDPKKNQNMSYWKGLDWSRQMLIRLGGLFLARFGPPDPDRGPDASCVAPAEFNVNGQPQARSDIYRLFGRAFSYKSTTVSNRFDDFCCYFPATNVIGYRNEAPHRTPRALTGLSAEIFEFGMRMTRSEMWSILRPHLGEPYRTARVRAGKPNEMDATNIRDYVADGGNSAVGQGRSGDSDSAGTVVTPKTTKPKLRLAKETLPCRKETECRIQFVLNGSPGYSVSMGPNTRITRHGDEITFESYSGEDDVTV